MSVNITRKVFSKRNSDFGWDKPSDLNQNLWHTDTSCGDFYLHVSHLDAERYDRIYPLPIKGYECKRLQMDNGVLKWIYDPKKGQP